MKVVCSKNHHLKKRAFNPEHDITPPPFDSMNPSAQWSTLVSLEDVLIVLTSILNLVSEIASMTSLTSDAATRRTILGHTIPFDKGSKVWHLFHDASAK